MTEHRIEIVDDPDTDVPLSGDVMWRCSCGEDWSGGNVVDAARNAAAHQVGDAELAELLGIDPETLVRLNEQPIRRTEINFGTPDLPLTPCVLPAIMPGMVGNIVVSRSAFTRLRLGSGGEIPELVRPDWRIGRLILERQEGQPWDSAVIDGWPPTALRVPRRDRAVGHEPSVRARLRRRLDHWTTGPLDHWTTGPLDHWTTDQFSHRLRGNYRGAKSESC
jgi:hypothetical protein